jgi:hypothetical protein
METPTTPKTDSPPAQSTPTKSYLVPLVILIGFLAAAVTYRIVTISDIEQSRNLLQRYEEIAKGRDYTDLLGDRRILSRIAAQSLHDRGRLPTPDEVELKAADLAEAGELAGELDEQTTRFTFFMDVIIYGLAGIIVVFLVVLLFKRRHRYWHR